MRLRPCGLLRSPTVTRKTGRYFTLTSCPRAVEVKESFLGNAFGGKMKRLSRAAMAAALVGSVFSTINAAGAEETAPDRWRGWVDAEGKLGSDRSLGEVSIFAPLWQNDDTLLFGNLITRMDDDDSREINFGGGVRHMLASDRILGTYAFFDRRRSPNDNYFNQVVLGAEYLSTGWDLRVNGYLADDDPQPTGGGAATLTGGQLLVQSNMEAALSGVDGEFGVKIPLGLDNLELRTFAGGFHFEDKDFGHVSGPRARAEARLLDFGGGVLPSSTELWFGAEYQEDNVRGSQGFLSLRLRVPLGGWDKPSSGNRFARRMTDPVVRDIDIVTGGGLSAPVVAVNQATGRSVSSGIVVRAGDDLATELVAVGADSVVIADGTDGFITSSETAILQVGQTLVGAGNGTINLVDPRTGAVIPWAYTGVRPTLDRVTVGMRTDTVLENVTIDSGSIYTELDDAPFPSDPAPVQNITITDVTITGSNFDPGANAGQIHGLFLLGVDGARITNFRFEDVDISYGGALIVSVITDFAAKNVVFDGLTIDNVNLSGNHFSRYTTLTSFTTPFDFVETPDVDDVTLNGLDLAPTINLHPDMNKITLGVNEGPPAEVCASLGPILPPAMSLPVGVSLPDCDSIFPPP